MTMSNLALTSLALVLCLPVMSPDGVPLVWYVAMSPISPFLDYGELGRWFVPMIAGVFLPIYFIPVFLTFNAVAWLSRRYSGKSSQPQSAVQRERVR
jgi:beta-lactamase regulating signal transducer with metallopeptidase domain